MKRHTAGTEPDRASPIRAGNMASGLHSEGTMRETGQGARGTSKTYLLAPQARSGGVRIPA